MLDVEKTRRLIASPRWAAEPPGSGARSTAPGRRQANSCRAASRGASAAAEHRPAARQGIEGADHALVGDRQDVAAGGGQRVEPGREPGLDVARTFAARGAEIEAAGLARRRPFGIRRAQGSPGSALPSRRNPSRSGAARPPRAARRGSPQQRGGLAARASGLVCRPKPSMRRRQPPAPRLRPPGRAQRRRRLRPCRRRAAFHAVAAWRSRARRITRMPAAGSDHGPQRRVEQRGRRRDVVIGCAMRAAAARPWRPAGRVVEQPARRRRRTPPRRPAASAGRSRRRRPPPARRRRRRRPPAGRLPGPPAGPCHRLR